MGIATLKGQLNLNTSQQAMWDNAVAAGKAARASARASHQKVHDTLTAELAKAEPDRWTVLDAGQPPEWLAEQTWARFQEVAQASRR